MGSSQVRGSEGKQCGIESVLAEGGSLPPPSLSEQQPKGRKKKKGGGRKKAKRPANAVIGLNSSMLKQFDFETSQAYLTEEENGTLQAKKKKSRK